MKKTLIALFAIASLASAASVAYNDLPDDLKNGVILGQDWNGGATVESLTGGTVSDNAMHVGSNYYVVTDGGDKSNTNDIGTPWTNLSCGSTFTISFDISNVEASAWNTIFSLASTSYSPQTDQAQLQLQSDGSGNLYLYNTAKTDTWGNPEPNTKYFGGFIVGSDDIPSATNMDLGLTQSDTIGVVTTLTFVSDATNKVFTAYSNGTQIGQWTDWAPTEDIAGLQFGQRYAGGRNSVQDATIDNFTIWNKALTSTEVAALIVPEPATASLSLLGLAAMMIRRRR